MTGGNGGIGLATISALAAKGAKVACLDITDSPAQSTDSVLYVKCDISSAESVVAAIDTVINAFGHIDILVNNAGVSDGLEKVADVSLDLWKRIMGVNINGPFHLMRSCIPHMLMNDPQASSDAPPSLSWRGEQLPPRSPSKGAIINICSTSSIHGAAAGAAYTASKHALLGLTRNTAWMYREQGIRVNAIMPGAVATPMSLNPTRTISPDGYQALQSFFSCQFPTFVPPNSIADAILFLAGPGAENITGAELAVDNAWSAA